MAGLRLSADGARRLRNARDYIVAHPEEFNMSTFIPGGGTACGTACCIAGHIMLGLRRDGTYTYPYSEEVSFVLGFGMQAITSWNHHPLGPLFFDDICNHDPVHHSKRINAFLWEHGYPEHELFPDPESEKARQLVAGAPPATREG